MWRLAGDNILGLDISEPVVVVDVHKHRPALHLYFEFGAEEENAGDFPVYGVDLFWRRTQSLVDHRWHVCRHPADGVLFAEVENARRLAENLSQDHDCVHVSLLHRLKHKKVKNTCLVRQNKVHLEVNA